MLEVTSIYRGIVIDHITSGLGYKLFKLLGLDRADYTVALIMNVESRKMGRKDIIKIDNEVDLNLDVLGLFGEGITVNVIDREEVVQKEEIHLPETIDSVLTCTNPRCVCRSERNVRPSFSLVDGAERAYACAYCDHIYRVKEIDDAYIH